MSWDPSLLRKFSNTGHFRLLNQVKSELSSQPLIRDPKTSELSLQVMPFKAQSHKNNRRNTEVDSLSPQNTSLSTPSIDEVSISFRERLDAIDPR